MLILVESFSTTLQAQPIMRWDCYRVHLRPRPRASQEFSTPSASKRNTSSKTTAATGDPKMKLIPTCACVFIFALSCCAFSWLQPSQPIDTSLCELYQHPDQYAGKMIRVRGTIAGNDMWIDTFTEKPCPSWMSIVVIFHALLGKPANATGHTTRSFRTIRGCRAARGN